MNILLISLPEKNKDMKLDRNVLSGNLHIKEGRMITPEDKDMCVISEELANQNNRMVMWLFRLCQSFL